MKNDQGFTPIIIKDQGGIETYLTEENLMLLRRMFKNKKSYSYYMRALWILRNLACNRCEIKTLDGIVYDKQHELFPILKITNELIGALSRDNTHITYVGEDVNCLIDGEICNIYNLDE